MLFCILVVVSATSVQSLFKTNAQSTQISPQYGCLGPCNSGTPSGNPITNTNGSTASASVQPASPSSIMSSITPTTQPCTTNSLNSLSVASQSADQASSDESKSSHSSRAHKGHHQDGGFLKDIFQLFLLMIELLLKLTGSGVATPCAPMVTPTVSAVPSVPVASASPKLATSSAATTSNPGTINANSGIFGGGPFGNSCKPGQFYCNGHIVTGGKDNTLYTCEPYNAPSVKQTCPGACKVNASGNDSC